MAKQHLVSSGNKNITECGRAALPGNPRTTDAAAVYAAYVAGDTCTVCNFRATVRRMRADNAAASETSATTLGLKSLDIEIDIPRGAQGVTITGIDGKELDALDISTLDRALMRAQRIMSARERVEERTSQPECVEAGCHATPIGWLDEDFSERRDYEGRPGSYRALTAQELARCEAHQPKGSE